MDSQLLSGRVHACHGARESEVIGSGLCHRVIVCSSSRFRREDKDLRNRPRDVVRTQRGALSECGNREDSDPTQRPSTGSRKSTGPPRTFKPQSRHRASNWPSKAPRAWTKQNENRHWGFDLGLPICALVEFKPNNERFGVKRNECGAAMRSTTMSNSSQEILQSLRSFRTRRCRE